MKKLGLCICCVLLWQVSLGMVQAMKPGKGMEQNTVTIKDTVRFHFASVEEAKRLISAEDDYTRNWSSFDIASRLENPKGQRGNLTELAKNEVREWTEEEKQLIRKIGKNINSIILKNGYQLPLPKEEIILVKSTLKDEGGAGGYTRSNWIALSDGFMKSISQERLTELLIHELFHVLTRNDLKFKSRMYETIHFNVIPNEIIFPKDIWENRISNPDVSRHDSYATFKIHGKAQNCAMILYTDRPYTTGKFYTYIQVGLVALDEHLKPVQKNGKTVIYSIEDASDFYDKVGENTRYIIHPEEIMASNFALAVLNARNVSTPDLQKRIQNALKQNLK